MKSIHLSGSSGLVAYVDDADFPLVSRYVWWADKKRYTTYAYTQTIIDGTRKTIRMHQLITGNRDWDHANRDGLDNRRANLRAATRAQQCWNSVGRGQYMYKGITHQKRLTSRPWQARICYKGHQMHLGYFPTPEIAALAYNEAALKYYGGFANLNYVNGRHTK